MQTLPALTPTFVYRHTRLRILTERPSEFVDITDGLTALLAGAGLVTGLLNVQSLHTTASIVVNEHEPNLLADFGALLQTIAPAAAGYRHDALSDASSAAAGERPNGHSHCRALVLPPSACLNVVDGRLQLGRWQRVFLVEHDGPRMREIAVVMVGEARR